MPFEQRDSSSRWLEEEGDIMGKIMVQEDLEATPQTKISTL